MTDLSPSGKASSTPAVPALMSAQAEKTVPSRPRPQPTSVVHDSPGSPRQKSTSAALTSLAHPQQQRVRRQTSHEAASPSSPQTQPATAQQPILTASVKPVEEAASRSLLAPFHTLVSTATSDVVHHPRVHYIFSDDEESEALDQALNHATHRHQHHQQHCRYPDGSSGGVASSRRPPFRNPSRSASASEDSLAQGHRDRAILLDLAPSADGRWEVATASSLSPDWAVVSAQLSKLKESDGASGNSGEYDGDSTAYMLSIEGVEGPGHGSHGAHSGGAMNNLEGSRGSAGRASSSHMSEYGVLIEEFDKKMKVLRKVVTAGDRKTQAESRGRAELGVVEEDSAEGER